MATTTESVALHTIQPDPLEPTTEEVERYIEVLQGLVTAEPELAQRETYNQIRLAGARVATQRKEALATLNAMFRRGAAPDPALDGPYRGILVATTTVRPADAVSRALAGAWMPWLGKRFDAAAQSGDNLLAPSARRPARLLWRSHQLRDAGDGRFAAFPFRTYVEAGKVDPDRETLKIDYDSDENPKRIRDILDELVQVVPGANLGKVLLRRGGGARWDLVGYFALQP